MQTTDQVAGEAREKLADRIENAVFAQRLQGEDSITLTASFSQWKEVIAALRAQPERGAEEMLTDPIAVHANMLRGVIAKPSVENIVHLYGEDALRRALPLHPAKDEGEGR